MEWVSVTQEIIARIPIGLSQRHARSILSSFFAIMLQYSYMRMPEDMRILYGGQTQSAKAWLESYGGALWGTK